MSLKLNFDKRRSDYYKKHALSFWDCVYYENKTPFALPLATSQTIFVSAKKEFENMSSFGTEDFRFNPVLNSEFDREVQNDLRVLEIDAETVDPKEVEMSKSIKAAGLCEHHFFDYEMLCNLLKTEHYPMSFKALMLNEFLTQTYKQNFFEGKTTFENHKRDISKSMRGIMNLDKHALDFVFANAQNYSNFTNLYFDSQKHSKMQAVKDQEILFKKSKSKKDLGKSVLNMDITTPNTFGLGKWIKFSNIKCDPKNFEQTAQNLSTLFRGTISCLDHNAWFYLSTDPVYVFVDHQNSPQIVACPFGKYLFEVHGMIEGQTIDEKYLDVAIDFLTVNKEVPAGKDFLNLIQANKDLCTYIHQIENGNFKEKDFKDFAETLQFVDETIIEIEGRNAHAKKAFSLLPKIDNMVQNYLKEETKKEENIKEQTL